jgi:hypothetical protein
MQISDYEARYFGGEDGKGASPEKMTFDEAKMYAFAAVTKALDNSCCWYADMISFDLGKKVYDALHSRWKEER